jgi:hypothetical protein
LKAHKNGKQINILDLNIHISLLFRLNIDKNIPISANIGERRCGRRQLVQRTVSRKHEQGPRHNQDNTARANLQLTPRTTDFGSLLPELTQLDL